MTMQTPEAPAATRPTRTDDALLDPDRALELVLEHTPQGRVEPRPVAQALGLWLAEDVAAGAPQPPFGRALMDGFAVCVEDGGRAVEVVDEAAAGRSAQAEVRAGVAVSIMTGAPLPVGTEAVVRLEDVEWQGERLRLPEGLSSGQHLQPAGALCRAGEVVLSAGTEMTPLALAAAISCGRSSVRVRQPPALAVVSTGDELSAAGEPLGAAQIHDSNGPMMAAMARAMGVASPTVLHGPDQPERLARVIEQAADADMLVLSGGVSMSRFDLVPEVLQGLGARIVFHRVRQRPGKPLLFAVRGSQLVFGLPGTPLGTHFGFSRYVATSIRHWLGAPPRPARLRGRLVGPLEARCKRTLFRLVRVEGSAEGYLIDPLRWRGSSDTVGPMRANAYCRFEPGRYELGAGTELDFEPIGPLDFG